MRKADHTESRRCLDKLSFVFYAFFCGYPFVFAQTTDLTDLRARFLEVSGPIIDESKRCPLDPQEIERESFAEYTRTKLTIQVEPGDRLPFYLLTPNNLTAPASAMLCLHPTNPHGKLVVLGLGNEPNRNYAVELAQRSYITLAPDYPGFGDYKPDAYAMGYASATAKGVWNHIRCIDYLQSLPNVDPARIGCIGHSLGGHNTLFLGLFDERVKLLVTSCGFTSFAKYYGGDLTGWSHKGYMPRIADIYGKDPAKMPWDFPQLLAALAPRPVFINAPLHDENFEVSGVRDCVEFAKSAYGLVAETNLVTVHPDCGHDFPPDVREQSYKFIDRALRMNR